MRRFSILANGNCFFNSFTVALFANYQQKQLENWLTDPAVAKMVAILLNRHIPGCVAAEPTTADLKTGFDACILSVSKHSTIDWVLLQESFSGHLRQMIIDFLSDDQIAALSFFESLNLALDQTIELSTATDYNFADFIAGKTKVTEAVIEIKKQKHLELDAQKTLLREWFWNQGGLQQFLKGPGGIANQGQFVGILEGQVIAQMFKVNIAYYPGKHFQRTPRFRQVIHGFGDESFNTEFTFEMVNGANPHWNVLLPPNRYTNRIISINAAQLAAYPTVDELELAKRKKEIKATHGSFKQHHLQMMGDIGADAYQMMLKITADEYDEDWVPVVAPPRSAVQPSVQTGFWGKFARAYQSLVEATGFSEAAATNDDELVFEGHSSPVLFSTNDFVPPSKRIRHAEPSSEEPIIKIEPVETSDPISPEPVTLAKNPLQPGC